MLRTLRSDLDPWGDSIQEWSPCGANRKVVNNA